MKSLKYFIITFAAIITASCSNEEITKVVEEEGSKNTVTMNVSLDKFFSTYDFNDTRHDIKTGDMYRTFNSEHDKYIQVRTLFYDKSNGTLVDSIINYVTTTNSVVSDITLPVGNYYAITTLVFSDEKDIKGAWWDLADKDNIRTAKMVMYSYSQWNIMSESAEEISVTSTGKTSVNTTPMPVGSLCYLFYENFQYKNIETKGTVQDNGIRSLGLYSQKVAIEYNLDPNSTSKYNYKEDAGSDFWWKIKYLEPKDFDSSWTYFKMNLYAYCYILAPQFNLEFGYTLQGETSFHGYGETTYTQTPGSVILAYWDYFQVGNPYFGPADNNHWHSYSSSVKALKAINPMVTTLEQQKEAPYVKF